MENIKKRLRNLLSLVEKGATEGVRNAISSFVSDLCFIYCQQARLAGPHGRCSD